MTDHYQTSLKVLSKLLKESGDEFRAKWVSKDLHLWNSEKLVDRHLIGNDSFFDTNDKNAGDIENYDIWKNRLIYILKSLTSSLAKGEISEAPVDTDFYVKGPAVINGWRCKGCNHSSIDESHLESFLSKRILSNTMVEMVKNNNLAEIGNLKEIFYSRNADNVRNRMVHLIRKSGINLTNGNEWLWRCPSCNCKEISAYKWTYDESIHKLIDSKDNLRIIKPTIGNKLKVMSKLFIFW